jgi:Uma2 family endonuclease
MVRPERRVPRGEDWNEAPIPLLVVEAMSPRTRQRDPGRKRRWYRQIGVGEYWILDAERRTIRVVRRGARDAVVTDILRWHRRVYRSRSSST